MILLYFRYLTPYLYFFLPLKELEGKVLKGQPSKVLINPPYLLNGSFFIEAGEVLLAPPILV